MTIRGVFRARWILPVDRPPIEHGWIEIGDGRIAGLGGHPPPAGAHDLGEAALLPGLTNAHTHLELSWLRGRIPAAERLVDWIRAVLAARAAGPPGGETERERAVRRAAIELRATGTVLVGDVTNTLTTSRILLETGLSGVVFYELVGFNAANPGDRVREAWQAVDVVGRRTEADVAGAAPPRLSYSVVAHAPYSVSPVLFGEISRQRRAAPLAVHLGESPEEIEFLRTGGGPLRDLLEELAVWNPEWEPPHCDPVRYVDEAGYLMPGMLAVHGVHLTDAALERLRDAGGAIVTCPRSNEWVGAGMPRVSHFYAAGMPVAIGTDSLASAPTLNLFDELAALRRIAPDVSAAGLLESATRVGAEVLGFSHDYGTLSPGKRAALVAVDVPAGIGDVEEYLVSGVPAAAIHADVGAAS